MNPEDVQSVALASIALRALGRLDEAEEYQRLTIRRGEAMIRKQPENSRATQMTFCSYATLGEREQAQRLIDHALQVDPDDTHLLYNAACASVQMGSYDRALGLLESWVGRVGADMHVWMRQDVDLNPRRGDERFKALLASLNETDTASLT